MPTNPSSAHPRHARRDFGPLVPLHHIEPERVAWLSPGRLAAGKLTLLDGDPGLGKSTLLCEFAARLTRGEALPGGQSGPPRGVILLSAEDDLVDTIRPRIDAAGGDPRRVYAIPTLPQEFGAGKLFAIPGHLTALEEIIPRLNVALVIIDPLLAFLERRFNANNDQHVRRAGVALKDFAERTGVAIVAVRHLNKSVGSNPLYRGGGSIGLIGTARCGLLLAVDPDDPARRVLAATKANLAQPPASLAFRLLPVPGADVPRVAWEGESPLTAADLLRPVTNREQASALNAVRAWLRGRLAAGPRRGTEVQAEAAAAGISLASLRRAREVEKIVIRKTPGRYGHWTWSLPEHNGQLAHPTPSSTS